MPNPQRLYTANEIAKHLGVTRRWLDIRLNNETAPKPEFTARTGGKDPMLLWSKAGFDRWEVFHASASSVPANVAKFTSYSDHKAVNRFSTQITVTWKLWFRAAGNGDTQWWFSTPDGWYISANYGANWRRTGLMVRPTEYKYHSICVNSDDIMTPTTIRVVLRGAELLRRQLTEKSGVKNGNH